MSTDDIDLFSDAQEGVQVSDISLGTISALTKKLKQAEFELGDLELAVSRKKEEIRILQEREIPDAMASIGMSSFKLDTGETIKVENLVRGSIPEKHKDEAFRWLRGHGGGDLIKRDITVQFGRGGDAKAAALIEELKSKGMSPKDKEAVAWNTLSSWAKEQLERGVDLPAEILGLYIGRRATVKA